MNCSHKDIRYNVDGQRFLSRAIWQRRQQVNTMSSSPSTPSNKSSVKMPVVLVMHTAAGPRDTFLYSKAEKLSCSRLQCLSVIVDMYGVGNLYPVDGIEDGLITDKDLSYRLRKPLYDDRSLIIERAVKGVIHALGEVKDELNIDFDFETQSGGKIAAIGFCLGGLAVLDLARSSLPFPLLGAVSFHGILDDKCANCSH